SEPNILGLLAWKALLAPVVGSVAVTPTFPRPTNIQPSLPSKRTPLGLSPPRYISTPLAYLARASYLPWTFHSPVVGNSAVASISMGPVCSVSIPQWAMSIWCTPQPVISPAPNCSQRNQPPRPC